MNLARTSTPAIYTIYGDQNAAILALKNGEVDFRA